MMNEAGNFIGSAGRCGKTPSSAEIPYITAKKNKNCRIAKNQDISGVSKSFVPEIAYIPRKKIKKNLTFNFGCARNNSVEKMNYNRKWRLLWLS
jgi:hypothetical protein